METTDLFSGMPKTNENDVNMEDKMDDTDKLYPGLKWVYNRLGKEAQKRFIRVATEKHPNGKSRQASLRQMGVVRENRKYREFHLGEQVYKLGTTEFDDRAKQWYDDSYWFIGAIGWAAAQEKRKVTKDKGRPGYILVEAREN